MRSLFQGLTALALILAGLGWAGAALGSDDSLARYIQAWLLHVHDLGPEQVQVQVAGGEVTLTGRAGSLAQIDVIVDTVAAFPGVSSLTHSLEVFTTPVPPPRERSRWSTWLDWLRPPAGKHTVPFPQGDLFVAPLADQKQPRFHTTYQRYDTPFGNFDIASVGFGENFGLLRGPATRAGDGWQVGLSGAVFAIFNLDGDSNDLLNADYYIGVPLSWRRGRLSARGRVYHLSSHLGDEFLLDPTPSVPPVQRINLSYEAVELLASWEWRRFRTYGGGSRIFATDTPLERNRLQVGVEYHASQHGWKNGRLTGGLDLQWWEETGWGRDLSIKVGLRFRSPYAGPRALQILLEYYDGHAPHGQFYPLEVSYLGIGLTYSL